VPKSLSPLSIEFTNSAKKHFAGFVDSADERKILCNLIVSMVRSKSDKIWHLPSGLSTIRHFECDRALEFQFKIAPKKDNGNLSGGA